jgi:tyrosyl-tRNA synthetase
MTTADTAARLRRATPDEQFEEVTRGHVDLHTADELRARLKESYDSGVPLRIKAGFDPTSSDLHLGHTVLLQRMRRFQDFGHLPVFIIGDLTATIGDPTGRNATRPPLSLEAVRTHAETYKQQVFKVLDPARTEVRYNSEWLQPMDFVGVVKLASRYTIARMLERDDFSKRFREQKPIAIHELLYPLAQGWDSVAVKADVELGGSDQLFNLLVGRQLMKEEGLRPQIVITGPILEGTDAKVVDGKIVGDKMSKSLGNYVGIAEAPHVQFQKLMPIVDDLLWRYMELLSAKSIPEVLQLKADVTAGKLHPNEAKAAFAREIVTRFHGDDAAATAAETQTVKVSLGGQPTLFLSKLLVLAGLVKSGGEAQRVVTQGGVSVDGERVTDWKHPVGPGQHAVTVGKRVRVQLEVTPD